MKLNKDNKLTKYPFKLWDKEDKLKATALTAAAITTLGLSVLGFGTVFQKTINASVASTRQEKIIMETIESTEYKEYFNEQIKTFMEYEYNTNDWVEKVEYLTGNDGVQKFLEANGKDSIVKEMKELQKANSGENLALGIGGFFLGILGLSLGVILSSSANDIKKDYDQIANNRGNVAYKNYVDRLENYEKALYPQEEKKEENTLAEIYLGDGKDMEQ